MTTPAAALCDWCLGPAGHAHPACGHCRGTGRCPVPFCIRCADQRWDDLPFPCGTCLFCAGEGIDHARKEDMPMAPDPVPAAAMQAAAMAEREWKRRAGLPDTETGYDTGRIRAMVEAAVAAEREACARLAEQHAATYPAPCTMADCPCSPLGESQHPEPFAALLRKDHR